MFLWSGDGRLAVRRVLLCVGLCGAAGGGVLCNKYGGDGAL